MTKTTDLQALYWKNRSDNRYLSGIVFFLVAAASPWGGPIRFAFGIIGAIFIVLHFILEYKYHDAFADLAQQMKAAPKKKPQPNLP